ncbi:FHA domain-containing protein FhaB/FipA [Bifidobacterium stellenboschense]|uniref:FHA domain-containing protein n=1 Tax=Bifidobacterium stellenboschense TaxID=762211 RepID=A0A087DJH0_9BIFI|nr:FHA domain-containing protein [Bifidobacterium stellenboschense]KFI95670.1 FHA domain-containing protein [Bifidobacterium stellenboschense]
MTELTFALLKYGFLILLWVFVWLAVRSLHKDIESFSPRPSRSRRRKERHAARKAAAPAVPVTGGAPVVAPSSPAGESPRRSQRASAPVQQRPAAAQGPSLLVIIDGPLAGSSVPLTGEAITLGRAASNTVVLDDEFVSSHHARVYADPHSGQWAIEDLGSTNGTVVNNQRLTVPTVLPARVPVRIGATTFELR